MARARAALAAAAVFLLITLPLALTQHDDGVRPHSVASVAQPLAFEPNAGRFAGDADFLVRDHGITLTTSPTGSVVGKDGGGASLRTRLVGASPVATGRGTNQLPGRINWYVGRDRSRWRDALPTFGGVRYRGVYDGIDLAYHSKQGKLEYDFIVAPGADPAAIDLALSGARRIRLNADGDLVTRVGTTTMTQLAPRAYQSRAGKRVPVAASFVLKGNRVGFRLGAYDRSRPLVIDPVLAYSDYVGGGATDLLYDVVADSGGNAYVGGYTYSTSIPGTATTPPAGPAGLVMKVQPGGQREWITYLGEWVTGVALGPGGTIYLAGKTGNALATTSGAAQSTFGGGAIDAFAGKLNADGSRSWVTYYGGGVSDYGDSIAVDGSGAAYFTGYTNGGTGLATTGQTTFGGGSQDAFLVKYSASGARVFSTYLGGGANDEGKGVGIKPGCESNCEVFVGGHTTSGDFPTLNAYDASFDGSIDAFVTKFNSSGARVWSTYAGSNNAENAHGLAVAPNGNVSLVGFAATASATNDQAFIRTYGGSGTSATLMDPVVDFGGSLDETVYDITYDTQGNFYLAGDTYSDNLYVADPVQRFRSGPSDGFVAKFKVGSGVFPVWSTYLGGGSNDTIYGVAVDPSGRTYVAGSTSSTDFPRLNATQGDGTGTDGFLSRIELRGISITSGPEGQHPSRTATFTYTSDEPSATYECRLSPAGAGFAACPSSGQTYTGLADGAYTFEVRPVDAGATPGIAAARSFTVDTTPVARFTIAPNPVLAGRSAVFDGSASTGGDTAIAKYEWDLNGDGVFERDTGTTATTNTVYDSAQKIPVSLRITNAGGASATRTVELTVSTFTGPSQFGVTINKGAQYTRTPKVVVTANFPATTTSLLLSNDGGFLKPQTFAPAQTINWVLDSSGPERLPKIVYVRFLNGQLVSETHIDDIILDETPPKVDSASVSPAAGAASAGAASIARVKRWKIRVKASDSNSGVSKLQVTRNKRKPGKALRYRKRLKVKSAKRPRFIRARDRAGNWSRWKKLR